MNGVAKEWRWKKREREREREISLIIIETEWEKCWKSVGMRIVSYRVCCHHPRSHSPFFYISVFKLEEAEIIPNRNCFFFIFSGSNYFVFFYFHCPMIQRVLNASAIRNWFTGSSFSQCPNDHFFMLNFFLIYDVIILWMIFLMSYELLIRKNFIINFTILFYLLFFFLCFCQNRPMERNCHVNGPQLDREIWR